MTSKKIFYLAVGALCLLFLAPKAFSQGDVVKDRKNLMRTNNRAVRAINKAVKENDFATIEKNANQVVEDMNELLALFPKGSTADNSRAKPDIWNDWDGFKAKQQAVTIAAEQLAMAAAAKDSKEVEAKVKALGTSGSGACGSCHRTYRARRKKR